MTQCHKSQSGTRVKTNKRSSVVKWSQYSQKFKESSCGHFKVGGYDCHFNCFCYKLPIL